MKKNQDKSKREDFAIIFLTTEKNPSEKERKPRKEEDFASHRNVTLFLCFSFFSLSFCISFLSGSRLWAMKKQQKDMSLRRLEKSIEKKLIQHNYKIQVRTKKKRKEGNKKEDFSEQSKKEMEEKDKEEKE